MDESFISEVIASKCNVDNFGPDHQDDIIPIFDSETTKTHSWIELSHLVDWSDEFVSLMKQQKNQLASLEVLRGGEERPIQQAMFHIQEAMDVVISALNFEVALDLSHPDSRHQSYAAENIMVEDQIPIQEIMKQIFARLYSKCVVRIVVKANNTYTKSLVSHLVDMMYKAGATPTEVKVLQCDRSDSLSGERFLRYLTSKKSSKLSVVATVFKQTDTFAAVQGIIESYFRDEYQNLIVLVDESAHERFTKDWQRYYSHALHIGNRADQRTTIVETLNTKVQIDLSAIDIKASHKMSGMVVNVLKFRTISELISLLSNLRKVPYMTVWNDDLQLAREFCIRVNQCGEFWLNHVPKSLAGRRFPNDILKNYAVCVSDDMAAIYNMISSQFNGEMEQLRKVHALFSKKDNRLRVSLTLQAYVSLVTKCKSLRNGNSIGESVARLRRFQLESLHRISTLEASDSRIETFVKPVGLAILLVRDETRIKSKPILVDFIFKNLLLGNAVLLVCPPNMLGAKFAFENDHVIPFKMVHDGTPDMSKLSLDSSSDACDVAVKKQCPMNTYAVEVLPEMSGEACETVTIALGSRRRTIWYPSSDQVNYWNE